MLIKTKVKKDKTVVDINLLKIEEALDNQDYQGDSCYLTNNDLNKIIRA